VSLVFLDTNVLVYMFDADAPRKQAQAQQLFNEVAREGRLLISTQVLQEFYVISTRKLAVPLTSQEAERAVRDLAAFTLIPIDAQIILAAIKITNHYRFSFWDSLIIQAAMRGGAKILYSEDLQDGQMIDELRVQNPFGAIDENGNKV